jgi:hypothetical protein
MRVSAEQRAARAAALSALGRLLQEIWEEEDTVLSERLPLMIGKASGNISEDQPAPASRVACARDR